MTSYAFICPRCGFGDDSHGLIDITAGACGVCHRETGKRVMLRIWDPAEDSKDAPVAPMPPPPAAPKSQARDAKGPKDRAAAHKPTPHQRRQIEAIAPIRECSDHHWKVAKMRLDWWPSAGKWKFDHHPMRVGRIEDLIAELYQHFEDVPF